MKQTVYVWDWGVRGFHWLLVLSILGSYLTGEWGWLSTDWHFYFGYFTLGLLTFRLVWGFVGNRHARFAGFLRGPGAVRAYLQTLLTSAHRQTSGHSALGGWASIVLILAVFVQAITGLMTSDDIFMQGPLAQYVSSSTIDLMTRVHTININLIYALIVLHLLASLFYLLVKRENLISPMLTGSKTLDSSEQPAAITNWRRLISAAIVGLAVVGMLWWIGS